jgi:hypothetical protein
MRLCKLALVFGAVALLVSPVVAQQPGRGRGMGMFGAGVAQLAQNKSVKEELKIDDDQAKKIKDALDKVNEEMKDERAKLGRGSDASQEERAAARKKINEAEMKALKDVLKPDQLKRLEQIRHQIQGVYIFQDEEVQKQLKLTDEQKEKINDVQKDLQKEMQEMFQGFKPGGGGGDFQENMKKMQGLQKEAMTNATKVLKEDQKKQLDELVGKPFTYVPEFGRGRGGKPGDKPRTDF